MTAFQEFAAHQDLTGSDLRILVSEGLADWERSGSPNGLLQTLGQLVFDGSLLQRASGATAKDYFTWLAKLRAGTDKWNGLSHASARRLLSHAPLILHLLSQEKMSCTQIARLLHAVEVKLDVPYQAVEVVARGLNRVPTLSFDEATHDLWVEDERLALELFPDGTAIDACEFAGEAVSQYLPETDFGDLLQRLASLHNASGDKTFWPYLQILHFCCVPLEYYDHPATYLYEFSPRGQVALEVFDRYGVATGNPILNNAKAVQSLDQAWARNRGGDNAHALVAVLQSLETLPHPTRKEVARITRAWLHRILEIETVEPELLPSSLNVEHFEKALAHVLITDTRTQGVIEQRIVDCLADLAFGQEGWRAKGLGDSVNASNFSRHKLGDVEYANVDMRSAIALEAHGGYLSATYVRAHQRSLARIVKQRLEESWASLDDPGKWTIRVIFVAHSRELIGLPKSEVLHGVNVVYDYWTYSKLVQLARTRTPNQDSWREVFVRHALEPMNLRETRQSARDKFVEISCREIEPAVTIHWPLGPRPEEVDVPSIDSITTDTDSATFSDSSRLFDD